MILFATPLDDESHPAEVDIEKVGGVFPYEDVIYFDSLPYRLSSLYSADKSVADQQSERIHQLLDDIRLAEGQLARGNVSDARQTLADAAGHYLSCDWWGGKECSCGGIR